MQADPITELLTRRVSDIIPGREALEKVLRSGKKIRLYQGFDPSSPNLHIGHLVGLQQLKAFQDLGHEVIFLIGDFTGMIGDPTDKTAARPKLTHQQIMVNAETYKSQAGKILPFTGNNPVKMLFNYDWLSKVTFADLIEITSNLTIQQLLERDMYQDRLKRHAPIYLHEFLYPVAQGFDSVSMDVDMEVGGNDQMFNLMVGRQLMKAIKGKEKFCLTTKLLTDSQGRKIGKTTGNAINLFGNPNDLYGQVMALPDETIINAFLLATALPLTEIESIKTKVKSSPMAQKKRLAFELVKLCHSQTVADTAQAHFEKTVQHKQVPDEIKSVMVKPEAISLTALLGETTANVSNSQIKRTIKEGGVEYNGTKITDPTTLITPKNGAIIKYGKRAFYKLIVK